MENTKKKLNPDEPWSRPLRLCPTMLVRWLAPGLALLLVAFPLRADTAPLSLDQIDQIPAAAVAIDTSDAQASDEEVGREAVLDTDSAREAKLVSVEPVADGTFTWELIRDSMNRLLTPAIDIHTMRYVARYMIAPELAEKIIEEATAAGIDPELAFRLVRVESRFHSRARSHRGALGLAQLMPSTARMMDRSLRTEAQILEPRTNLRLGFRYLRHMIERYDDVRLGLLAYNRGPGTVDRVLRNGRNPENGYSRMVLGAGVNRYRGPGLIDPKGRPVRERSGPMTSRAERE
jgi:soluble lytic murein transglycosylase-like protein